MNSPNKLRANIHTVRKAILSVFAVSLIFSLGYALGYKGFVASAQGFPKVTINRELPESKKDINFNLFWNVWDSLGEKYYDKSKLVESQMVYGAIQGMVAAVGDPYTIFLPPSENKVVEDDLQGNFSGVGIEIGFKGNQMAVTAPLPGSPAEKAGVKAGDLIVGIKDPAKNIEQSTQGMTLSEAVKIIRGPVNTKVTLFLMRDGLEKPEEVEVSRQTIEVPSIETKYVGENGSIAQIKLQKFGAETVSEWNDVVINVLRKQEVKGLILDVRNNPGGYMQAAIEIASDFVKEGTVVVIEDRGENRKTEYKSDKPGRLQGKKVVLLINGGSASASEILSGALRDNLSAKLIGEKSFGKGTIQEPLQLENGAGLHVTIAKWLTPNGTWVHGEGLTPDIEVKNNPDTPEDEQLQEAINAIN